MVQVRPQLKLFKASITWVDHDGLRTNWRGECMETTIIKAQDKLLCDCIKDAGEPLQTVVYSEVQLAVW